jgi:site-specific recombinase XerC
MATLVPRDRARATADARTGHGAGRARLAGGFRHAELVALDLADYDRESGRLRVIGKGNKERAVFLANGARDALRAWLRVRAREPGPLLVPVDRHGRVLARRLTEQTVYDRLRYLAERAGVAAFSPDDCRRSLAGDLLDAGVDLATVQRCSGTRALGRRHAMIAAANAQCVKRRSACRCPTRARDDAEQDTHS